MEVSPRADPADPHRFRAMGSEFEVLVWPPAPSVAADIEAEVHGLEQTFSRFIAASEVSRLNQRAGSWVGVSEQLLEVVSLARSATEWSGGIFNPLVRGPVEAAGYPGSPHTGEPCFEFEPGVRIDLDSASGRVRVPPGHGLDLGGIVKGWTADRLVSRVKPNGFVNAGGDLRAAGPGEDGFGWVVGIEDPRRPGYDSFVIALRDEAAATSGTNRRRWVVDGETRHHLIDPRTGHPAVTDVAAATVVAATCVRAEIAAKTALILGATAGLAWLVAHGMDGIMMLERGGWVATPGMRERLL